MEDKLVFSMTLALSILALFVPKPLLALEEDACTNDAVPRTTPSSHFTVIGDGSIVRHEVTGLEWQRCTFGQSWDGSTCTGLTLTRTWQEALDVAAAAGESWRLPNINELRSIVEECRAGPAINRIVFPNNAPEYFFFWSATPWIVFGDSAWMVDFSDGRDWWQSKSDTRVRVRLVRGGQ